jgi:hypothetical protein
MTTALSRFDPHGDGRLSDKTDAGPLWDLSINLVSFFHTGDGDFTPARGTDLPPNFLRSRLYWGDKAYPPSDGRLDFGAEGHQCAALQPLQADFAADLVQALGRRTRLCGSQGAFLIPAKLSALLSSAKNLFRDRLGERGDVPLHTSLDHLVDLS